MKNLTFSLWLMLGLGIAHAQHGFFSHIGGSYDVGSIVGYPEPTSSGTYSTGQKYYAGGDLPYSQDTRWVTTTWQVFYTRPMYYRTNHAFEMRIGLRHEKNNYQVLSAPTGMRNPPPPSLSDRETTRTYITGSIYKDLFLPKSQSWAFTTGIELGGRPIDFMYRALTPTSYRLQAEAGIKLLRPKWSASLSAVVAQSHFGKEYIMYRYFTTNSLRLTIQGRSYQNRPSSDASSKIISNFFSHIGGSYDMGSIVGYPKPVSNTASIKAYPQTERWKTYGFHVFYSFPFRIANMPFESRVGIAPTHYQWKILQYNGSADSSITDGNIGCVFATGSLHKDWQPKSSKQWAITTGAELGCALIAPNLPYRLEAEAGIKLLRPKWSASLSAVVAQSRFAWNDIMYHYLTTNSLRLTIQGRSRRDLDRLKQ